MENILSTTRLLNVGETVQVLIYRLYVLDGDKTYLKENSAMTSADVFYI